MEKLEELLEDVYGEPEIEVDCDPDLDSGHQTYKAIGKHQIGASGMSRDEHLEILHKIDQAKTQYTEAALRIDAVLAVIVSEYWSKKDNAEALSKLSDSYNTSKPGLNRTLSAQIHKAFEQYLETGNVKYLVQAGLSRKLLFRPRLINEILCSDHQYADPARQALASLQDSRSILLSSILKMVATTARIRTKDIPDVVSYLDAIQYGLLCAWEVTLGYKYDPHNETPAKWSSYAFHFIDKGIARYVAEQTRPVDIPRTLLDRWSPVAEALVLIEEDNYAHLAKAANEINSARKLSSTGRTVGTTEAYTEAEIESLILATRNAISLDGPLARSEPEPHEDSLKDTIQSEVDQEEVVESAEIASKFQQRLREVLDDESIYILCKKWGIGGSEVISLDQIVVDAGKAFNKTYTKELIKKIENKAKKKLSKDKELLALWLES